MCLDLSLFYFVLNFIEYSFLVQWFHIIFFFKNAFLEIFRPMSRVWRNEITKCCETRIVLSALYKGGGGVGCTEHNKGIENIYKEIAYLWIHVRFSFKTNNLPLQRFHIWNCHHGHHHYHRPQSIRDNNILVWT